MTSPRTSTSTSFQGSIPRTCCGIYVSQGSSIARLTGRHSCRLSTSRMVYLWSLKTRFNIYRSFMTSSSSQAPWKINRFRLYTHIWLVAMKFRGRIEGWNVSVLKKYRIMSPMFWLSRTKLRRPQINWMTLKFKSSQIFAELTLRTLLHSSRNLYTALW